MPRALRGAARPWPSVCSRAGDTTPARSACIRCWLRQQVNCVAADPFLAAAKFSRGSDGGREGWDQVTRRWRTQTVRSSRRTATPPPLPELSRVPHGLAHSIRWNHILLGARGHPPNGVEQTGRGTSGRGFRHPSGQLRRTLHRLGQARRLRRIHPRGFRPVVPAYGLLRRPRPIQRGRECCTSVHAEEGSTGKQIYNAPPRRAPRKPSG